jgi:alpha-1,2-mannosyltransferase
MLTRWPSRPVTQRAIVLLVVAIVTAQAAVIANRRATRVGHFDVSREFGRRLLAGEPLYAGGLHYPYMPSAALYFAPLALLPPGLGLAARYAIALGCLWLSLHLLHRMVSARARALAGQGLALAALTLILASHYVLRDLDDGGPHLIVLAMLVAGIWFIWRDRPLAGAAWLGLAAALKAPNGLFIAFFLYRREWRLAAATAAALAAWTLLPAAWMGPASWWQHQRLWARTAITSAVGAPGPSVAESEGRVQNQALRAVLQRHGAAASAVAIAGLGALVAATLLAWRRSRRSARTQWPAESSAVLLLSLLLSPVTWVQHLVLLVPALYLIAAVQRDTGLRGPAAAAMGLYFVLAVILNRELLGRDAYLFLLAHGLHTVCILLVLGVLLSTSGSTGIPAGDARSAPR